MPVLLDNRPPVPLRSLRFARFLSTGGDDELGWGIQITTSKQRAFSDFVLKTRRTSLSRLALFESSYIEHAAVRRGGKRLIRACRGARCGGLWTAAAGCGGLRRAAASCGEYVQAGVFLGRLD